MTAKKQNPPASDKMAGADIATEDDQGNIVLKPTPHVPDDDGIHFVPDEPPKRTEPNRPSDQAGFVETDEGVLVMQSADEKVVAAIRYDAGVDPVTALAQRGQELDAEAYKKVELSLPVNEFRALAHLLADDLKASEARAEKIRLDTGLNEAGRRERLEKNTDKHRESVKARLAEANEKIDEITKAFVRETPDFRPVDGLDGARIQAKVATLPLMLPTDGLDEYERALRQNDLPMVAALQPVFRGFGEYKAHYKTSEMRARLADLDAQAAGVLLTSDVATSRYATKLIKGLRHDLGSLAGAALRGGQDENIEFVTEGGARISSKRALLPSLFLPSDLEADK